jgi:hypothetical protein
MQRKVLSVDRYWSSFIFISLRLNASNFIYAEREHNIIITNLQLPTFITSYHIAGFVFVKKGLVISHSFLLVKGAAFRYKRYDIGNSVYAIRNLTFR